MSVEERREEREEREREGKRVRKEGKSEEREMKQAWSSPQRDPTHLISCCEGNTGGGPDPWRWGVRAVSEEVTLELIFSHRGGGD